MAAKRTNTKSKKPAPAARYRSRIRSAAIGSAFNMVATTASFGSVLLCLIIAKHIT